MVLQIDGIWAEDTNKGLAQIRELEPGTAGHIGNGPNGLVDCWKAEEVDSPYLLGSSEDESSRLQVKWSQRTSKNKKKKKKRVGQAEGETVIKASDRT